MADRPILFSAPMVRALLDDCKTQTRRMLKPQPGPDGIYPDIRSAKKALRIVTKDLLWVRESWDFLPLDEPKPAGSGRAEIVYWADADRREFEVPEGFDPMIYGRERFRPSIHMPRWASRLTLTVTDVRVQRLQDISEADAWAEGCKQGHPDDVGGYFPAEEPDPSGIGFRGWDNARDWYADLWDAINGEGSWDANPWVAAYSFTVERRNIDAVAAEAA